MATIGDVGEHAPTQSARESVHLGAVADAEGDDVVAAHILTWINTHRQFVVHFPAVFAKVHRGFRMQAASSSKSLRVGEVGLVIVLAAIALACLFIAAKTIEPAYAFHMWLGVPAGAAGIFAIFQRYNARPAGPAPLEIDGKPNYNFGPVKFASLAALFWGLAGMAVGIYIAFELAFPWLNIGPWFNFGRLRPLHTSAVIFAFGGNVLLATSFYVVQRTCRARLAGDLAPWFVVLGYNFFIVIAGTGYLLGITEGKEYAEPEWYSDLWLTIVWVTYLLVFLGTIFRRKEPHIYVANWFYLAFIVTIAMLHLGNNAAIPISIFSSKSVIVWSGVQDAMFQWWYGHNAVGFFLTAGFLASCTISCRSAPSGRSIPIACRSSTSGR